MKTNLRVESTKGVKFLLAGPSGGWLRDRPLKFLFRGGLFAPLFAQTKSGRIKQYEIKISTGIEILNTKFYF